jgi:alpha-L-rhamnosidase
VRASFESSYGMIKSGWESAENGTMSVKVRIPANTIATVILPVDQVKSVTEGGKPITEIKDITNIRVTDKKVTFEAGSGDYTFGF